MAARSSTIRKRTLAAFRDQNMKYVFRIILLDLCLFVYRWLFQQKISFHISSEFLPRSGKHFRYICVFYFPQKNFYSPVVNGLVLVSSLEVNSWKFSLHKTRLVSSFSLLISDLHDPWKTLFNAELFMSNRFNALEYIYVLGIFHSI